MKKTITEKLKSLPSVLKTNIPVSPGKHGNSPGSPLKRKNTLKMGKTGTKAYFGGTQEAYEEA